MYSRAKNKIKEVFKFFWGCNISSKLKIIGFVIDIPGILFHELAHYFFAFIFFHKPKLKCHYFFKIKNNVLKSYLFSVNTTFNEGRLNRVFDLIIAIAPLIFNFLLFLIFPIFTLCWAVISWKVLFLSEQDIKVIKNDWKLIWNINSKIDTTEK